MTRAGRPKRSLRRLATIPTTPACQPVPLTMISGSFAWARGLLAGLFADDHLDRAALLVEAVELGGDGARFLRVGGGQQADAKVGLADPAPGIDPRAQREAEVAARRRFHQPRRLGQRDQPDIAALAHHLEPLRDEGAVEALEPRDIGDGPERDEVKQIEDRGLGDGLGKAAAATQFADQRHAEQERHPDRGEMAVRRAFWRFRRDGWD